MEGENGVRTVPEDRSWIKVGRADELGDEIVVHCQRKNI